MTVERSIYMPVDVVADSQVLQTKLTAQCLWGQKAANLDLQCTNLLQSQKLGRLRFAYATVGMAALRSRANHAALQLDDQFDGSAADRFMKWCEWMIGSTPPTQAMRWWRYVPAPPLPLPPRGDEPPPEDDRGDGSDKKKGGKPSKGVASAESAVRLEQQRAAAITGETLASSTVEGDFLAAANVSNNGSPDQEGVGTREAFARFPQLTGDTQYLFSNNAQNLAAANSMRNAPTVAVGDHRPAPRHKRRADVVVDWMIENVFTPKAMRWHIANLDWSSGFPAKYSEAFKLDAVNSTLLEAETEDGVAWSPVVEAFVKAEVSGKQKPRPIVNHKKKRVAALAAVAYVYEHTLFGALKSASIKERTLPTALAEILHNMGSVRDGNLWFENDLSSFEFGISAELKEYECRIFKHIAKCIGVLDIGDIAFSRVWCSRTRKCIWTMTYTDETGKKCRMRLRMPNVMRESGDRVTSSGNWLQNVIAWITFLCDDSYLIEALTKFLRSGGKSFFYRSDRDGKMYLARLAFEGDDTLGRTSEFAGAPEQFCAACNEFFKSWGWAAKLKTVVGTGALTFVGRQVYIKGNKPVYDGATLVSTPEIVRFLKTKSWSTSQFESKAEQDACVRLYAAAMAGDFAHLEPLYRMCEGMYNAHGGSEAATAFDLNNLSDTARRGLAEVSFRMTGDYFASRSLAEGLVADVLPGFLGGSQVWRDYACEAAGPCSDLEWASMCGLTTTDCHGLDLASYVPQAWLA